MPPLALNNLGPWNAFGTATGGSASSSADTTSGFDALLQQASQPAQSSAYAVNQGNAADAATSSFSNADSSSAYYAQADSGSGSTADASSDLSSPPFQTSFDSTTSFEDSTAFGDSLRTTSSDGAASTAAPTSDSSFNSRESTAEQSEQASDSAETSSTTTPANEDESTNTVQTATHSDPEVSGDHSPADTEGAINRSSTSHRHAARTNGSDQSDGSSGLSSEKTSGAVTTSSNTAAKPGSNGAAKSGSSTDDHNGTTPSAPTVDPSALIAQPNSLVASLPAVRPTGSRGKTNPGERPTAKVAANESIESAEAAPASSTGAAQADSDTQGLTLGIQSGATAGQIPPPSTIASPAATKAKGLLSSVTTRAATTASGAPSAAESKANQATAATESDLSASANGPAGANPSASGAHPNGPLHHGVVQAADPNNAAAVATVGAATATDFATADGDVAPLLVADFAAMATKAIGPVSADNSSGNPTTQNSVAAAGTTSPATSAAGANSTAAASQSTGQSGASGMSDVDRVRFVQRVARAFQAADQDSGQIRLRLSPPELGVMKLDLTLSKGSLTAHVETETSAARTMLLDNLPQLRDKLAEHNIKIEHFDINVMNRSHDGTPDNAAGGYGDSQQSGARGGKSNATSTQAATGVAPITGSVLSTDNSGALNVLI